MCSSELESVGNPSVIIPLWSHVIFLMPSVRMDNVNSHENDWNPIEWEEFESKPLTAGGYGISTSSCRASATNKCAPSHHECFDGAETIQCRPDQIPCWPFWFCNWTCARRPFGSKWKHPSSAAPPTSASRSIDVEKARPLITFRTARRSEFGSVIVVRAELNCMKLFNGPLMIHPFTWLMWCEAERQVMRVCTLPHNWLKSFTHHLSYAHNITQSCVWLNHIRLYT